MDLELTGKTVLITGASKGIGRACADAFAAEGANLHIVSRTEADLKRAAEEIRSRHQVAVTVHARDLSVSRNVDELFEATSDIDILINNAGAIPGGSIDKIDEATWREAWDLKVFGYINMTRRYLAAMRERGSGVIVNDIGTGGDRVSYDYIAGAGGNASLMAFTRAIGGRSIHFGVRVVGVNPGPVETDRIQTAMQVWAEAEFGDPGKASEFYANWPMQRFAKPEEVADLIVFLASARASYISGTIFTIDGGKNSDNMIL
ncbi:SDR family oxidoreductase [Candidatus Entotheonella palauensis]|uniref:Short-chain dehydrogenase n=1 Tax=Candidatus Entotheonella gemina TaxID=1429439 RepID=W4LNS3_9BACT|nr:SDR family oxidoreductase [Candidatus Entotheonella palauensis]ETW99622.1 MAG: short-chain dehydrogenase [Candidatus Entotheonella gemina]